MSERVTKAQAAALRVLSEAGISFTTWGTEIHAGDMRGVTRATLGALLRKKLAYVAYVGNRQNWTITDAGRAALSQSQSDR